MRNQIASLRGSSDSTALSQALAQLGGLAGLERQIAHAGAKDLASIRNEVTAYVAATQSFLQQSSQAGGKDAGAQSLHAASAAARQAVADFSQAYYEQRIFDPYLKFASVEDEEAYRRREAERQHAIEKATAEKTPQGDLRANNLAIDQLKDAGAHGADRSPDFQTHLDKLQSAKEGLTAAIQKQPKEPELSAGIDPLDAAKPAEVSPELLASIRSSGVSLGEQDAEGHGLNQNLSKGDARVRG